VEGTSGRTLLRLGLGGIAFFTLALAVLHIANWEEMGLGHGRHVSNFHHMPGGWVWQVGLVGLGGGILYVVEGLRRTLHVDGPATLAFWGLRIAGVAILAMLVFPTDRYYTPGYNSTVAGYIHDTCAVLSTFFISWSSLLLVAAARADPAWKGIPGRSWGWPFAIVGLATLWMLGDVTPGGIGGTPFWQYGAVIQRAVVVVMAGWLMLTAYRALQASDAGSGTPQPTPPPRPTR
jgi:hypothetical protein